MNWDRVVQLALLIAIVTMTYQSILIGRQNAALREQTTVMIKQSALIEEMRARCPGTTTARR